MTIKTFPCAACGSFAPLDAIQAHGGDCPACGAEVHVFSPLESGSTAPAGHIVGEQCESCDAVTVRLDGDGCSKWCCRCGAKLEGNYVTVDMTVSGIDTNACPPTAPANPVAKVSVVNIDPHYPSPGRNVYVKWLGDNEAKVLDGALLCIEPLQAEEPVSLCHTHLPLLRNAISLLRMRQPVAPDVERVAEDLEAMLTGIPAPAEAPAQAWLDVASKAEQSTPTEKVVVEKDFMGTAHIKLGDFDFIQVQYQYPYVDNQSQNSLVKQIVALLTRGSD